MQRSFAMRVYVGAYLILSLAFLYIFVFVLLPGANQDANLAGFIPILGAFLGLFVLAMALAAFWPSAPRRPWFWLLAMFPAVGFILMNAPYLPYSATHPSDSAFPATLPLIVWSVAVAVSGWVAYREAKAARAAAAGSAPSASGAARPRAVWAVAIALGLTLGVVYSGGLALATGGSGAGAGLAAAPTQADTLVAQGTKYLTTSYTMKAGGVLGLFVVNHDAFAHSFDIDALNVHVSVPANGSVAVAVTPAGPGSLAFYCSVPGHREAGMAGTITVQ